MNDEFLSKIMAMYEAQLQKEKALYAAIANISQAAIDQDNLKSIALLAVLREQQKQPEAEQSKEQKQPEAKAKEQKHEGK